MSKVAVMMSENQVKSQMSSHFGKAEWVMVADTDSRAVAFLKNEAANGRSVIDLVSSQNCSDAIFSEIGNGALGHLKAEGIRGLGSSREYQRTASAGDVRAPAAAGCGYVLRARMLWRETRRLPSGLLLRQIKWNCAQPLPGSTGHR